MGAAVSTHMLAARQARCLRSGAGVDARARETDTAMCQTWRMADLTILVADDHPLFRAAVIHVLQQTLPQADVVEASSAATLSAMLRSHPQAELVLLDLAMPGARGFSALLHVRGEHPDIRWW